MRGLPGRYATWMARDIVTGTGLVMALLVALSLVLVRNVHVIGPGGSVDLDACLTVLDWTAMGLTLLATGGLVSGDFAQGHQRTLFAKPLSPPLYYLQRWLIGMLPVAIGSVVIAYAIGRRFELPVLTATLFARMGLLYLVLGGLVLLLSIITRRDWLLAIVVVACQAAVRFARSAGIADGPVSSLLYAILPPFQLVGLRGPFPGGAELAYAAGYGAALLLAALALLEWRPLARGARD